MASSSPWQWTDLIQPALTGLAALSGVYLGAWLTDRREARKETAKVGVERTYLVCLVAAHLDRLAGEAASVAYDDGTSYGEPAGENGCLEVTVSAPTFKPLDLEVDWKALPKDLMFAVLDLPRQLDAIGTALQDPGLDDPPYDDYFYERRRLFAQFSLRVDRLIRELRSLVDMPFEHVPKGQWSREEAMAEKVMEFQKIEARKRERQAKYLAEMNASDDLV